eukprot:277222-Pleurochrysis_carterae.AAC.1
MLSSAFSSLPCAVPPWRPPRRLAPSAMPCTPLSPCRFPARETASSLPREMGQPIGLVPLSLPRQAHAPRTHSSTDAT